ncbi:hypothetical protein [Liquorilactobacillus nagelii]|uniref:hypothetical protein n=1 Tax=Liquorilactobacillus nagelii TaxID=82688 RepID=UPI001CCC28F0|nr:hypothetical protein [Liquorilactobacillus nagelii]ULQ49363.1 hypothetical protein J6864_10535 [Liquorilactobacillus nagelii]
MPIDVHNYQTKRLKGKHKTKPDLKAEKYENKIRDDLLSKIKGKGLILNIK